MKNVKASEARKHWFRLLDEALRGEVIAVERKGQRVVLRREEPSQLTLTKGSTQYKKLLKVPAPDEADQWSWDWRPGRGLDLRKRSAK
jgi:antitoxin (DNA-binding transcriptional repressor) of toxin-antitoxin stability system